MEATADALKEIADSEVHKSKGTTALAEQAEGVRGDLQKASIRYFGTGDALYPYGDALRTARAWYSANEEPVRNAENVYRDASDERYEAVTAVTSGADGDAADTLTEAQSGVTSAKETRDELWAQFVGVFDGWET